MIKVGITGQSGFVGTHLYNTLGLYPGEFERVPFEDDYFVDVERLKTFVKSCDPCTQPDRVCGKLCLSGKCSRA